MKNPIKIILASAVIMAYLFSPGVTLAETDGYVELIPLAQEDSKTEENIKGTPMFVYGYSGPNNLEIEKLKALGLNFWYGQSSLDENGKNIENALFMSLGRLPEEILQNYNLVELQSINVPMFLVTENIGNEDFITYVTSEPKGNVTIDTVVADPSSKLYKIFNLTTGEERLVPFEEAKDVNNGKQPGWSYRDIFNRKEAIASKGKISASAIQDEVKRNKSCEFTMKFLSQVKEIEKVNNAYYNIESGTSATMHVSGRYVDGKDFLEDYLKVPEGMLLWSSQGGNTGPNPDKISGQTLLLSFTPISDEVAEANDLVRLGDKNATGFYVKEQFPGQDKPVIYVRKGLNGPGEIVGAILPDENGEAPSYRDPAQVEAYIIEDPETHQVTLVTKEEVLEKIAQGFRFIGINDREMAMKYGLSCHQFNSGNSNVVSEFHGMLSAQQDVVGMGH